jgi:hypothetical protein
MTGTKNYEGNKKIIKKMHKNTAKQALTPYWQWPQPSVWTRCCLPTPQASPCTTRAEKKSSSSVRWRQVADTVTQRNMHRNRNETKGGPRWQMASHAHLLVYYTSWRVLCAPHRLRWTWISQEQIETSSRAQGKTAAINKVWFTLCHPVHTSKIAPSTNTVAKNWAIA